MLAEKLRSINGCAFFLLKLVKNLRIGLVIGEAT